MGSNVDRVIHFIVSPLPRSSAPIGNEVRGFGGLIGNRDLHPTPLPSFQATFTIPNHTFTGLKVNQLKVVGDVMYKPFKGVRQVAKAGKIDFRW